MKWTSLRLNMLPITAVEIQYACQTLTNIHNALVDATAKQSLVSIQKFHIKPFFASSQTFLSQSSSKSSLAQSNKKVFDAQPMTYEKLFKQYQKLKEQMYNQVHQLKKFYTKNSQDESASLFHMLRLKLQRCLFDCNFQQNQTKKVMTKAQQEMKYNQIAKNFESTNQSKSKLQSISETQKQFLQSCETFKTQNYTGYEQQSMEASQNQFLHFQDQNYEELFHQEKVQNKKQYSKSSLNLSLEKRKNSITNTQRNSKQVTKRLSNSKIPLKKEPNSQMTIATLNEREMSSQKINFTNIQNEQKNYKNLKVLTNNNSSFKNINKTNQVKQNNTKQGPLIKQNSTTQNFNQSILKNNKNQKTKSYAVLNQKKQEQNKIINIQQKQKIIGKNQGVRQNLVEKNSIKKTQIIPPTKNIGQKISNSNHESDMKVKNTPLICEQQTIKTADNNDLKEILMSKGSQLRFTIKMSREQYKSLLELKSKMNEKQSK